MYLFTEKIKTVKMTIVVIRCFIIEYKNILLMNIILGTTKYRTDVYLVNFRIILLYLEGRVYGQRTYQ